MMARLWRFFRNRRETRSRQSLDSLKVRYHTFRILLANSERALDRLGNLEAALTSNAPAGELIGLVEDALAVTFEMVDGATRLAARDSGALYARQLRLEEELRATLETVEESGRGPSCLSLAQPLDPGEVGGKAAGLSLLLRNGFPVPDGFAVTARACRDFLRETGLDERIRRTLGAGGTAGTALGPACDALRRAILETPLPAWLREELHQAAAGLTGTDGGNAPPRLAARSSALTEDRPEHSFAGQFVTELNLSPQTLERGFSTVMAGAFSEQAVVYRLEAGLAPATLDMAVLVQVMVPAVAAGVVYTVDPVRPETGRMRITAVPGLGILAVNGAAPVDIYRVDRDDPGDTIAQLARKTRRATADPSGGVRREAIAPDEQKRPVLAPAPLARLARLALAAEALAGSCRDLEYAVDGQDRVWLLQSRPAKIVWGKHRPTGGPVELYRGGMAASPGRCLGRVRHVPGKANRPEPLPGPFIAVLSSALPEAGHWLAQWQGLVVSGGSGAETLPGEARAWGRPLLTRATGALEALPDGGLAVLDAGGTLVQAVSPAVGAIEDLLLPPPQARPRPPSVYLSPARARIRDLVVPLSDGSVQGPAASALECRSLRDIIRFARETAVLSLWPDANGQSEAAFAQARLLDGPAPFALMIIDLGGGLREDAADRPLTPEALASLPLAALWRGLAARERSEGDSAPDPGRPDGGEGAPASTPDRAVLDQAPCALAARDYVNLNARAAWPGMLLDAVCGPRARGNYARLRFKDSAARGPLRERRALCLTMILQGGGFTVDGTAEMLTASLADATGETTATALELLGRLLGLSRQFDALLSDDAAPRRLADAFLAGDTEFFSRSNHE